MSTMAIDPAYGMEIEPESAAGSAESRHRPSA